MRALFLGHRILWLFFLLFFINIAPLLLPCLLRLLVCFGFLQAMRSKFSYLLVLLICLLFLWGFLHLIVVIIIIWRG